MADIATQTVPTIEFPRVRRLRPRKPKMQRTAMNVNAAVGDLLTEPRVDEPFYVVDLGDICRKVKLWRLQLPRVKPFYAIKCNPLPQVLKTLAHFGLGFDCASKSEIDTVLKETGVDPSRIIYANPCKTKSFIRHAQKNGVTRMTFDNMAELEKIAEVYPEAELILRIKVDDSGSLMQFSSKFGADLAVVPDLLETAADLGLNIVGVSFHVGSGCCEPNSFKEAISIARSVFDQAALYGFDMNVLDLGGGFPGNAGSETLFDKCARAIDRQLDESFPSEEFPDIEIIAEPGRFIVASAFALYATVIAKRCVQTDRFMYYLNDGVYGSFNCKVFDHHNPEPVAVGKSSTNPSFMSVLWGPTCDSLDKVHDGVQLPELAVGDWLLFRDMGAYTCSAASAFNGFAKPNFHFVVSAAAEILLGESPIGRELLGDLLQKRSLFRDLINRIHGSDFDSGRII
ncbi:antizyme inhibitor 2 [Galendromus occidentalis]|uniref:ornithine decarboxylase n=1 Tax=Galendromus occidentalis TaxID=34638 RepID=A0AAJ6W004_9ACAR|nr:antizyme inhibitor 2 [Galendromus occidentalis]